MPLYEYQCQDCDTHFERIERASAPHDGVCPACGGAARRLLGAPALKFKGSGWYVNDYGKGNGSSPAPMSEAKNEATSEPKSEPATNTESSTKRDPTPRSDSKVA